jgi:hypothetical protein
MRARKDDDGRNQLKPTLAAFDDVSMARKPGAEIGTCASASSEPMQPRHCRGIQGGRQMRASQSALRLWGYRPISRLRSRTQSSAAR